MTECVELVCIEVQHLQSAIVCSSSGALGCGIRRCCMSLLPSAAFGLTPEFFCRESGTCLPEKLKLITQLMSDSLKDLYRVISMHS